MNRIAGLFHRIIRGLIWFFYLFLEPFDRFIIAIGLSILLLNIFLGGINE